VELYGALGKLLFLRGDYVGAATAFEGAVSDKGNPQDFSAWANLADTLSWIAGRNEDAKQAYAKARNLLTSRLELNPKDAILISQSALFAAKVGDSTAALSQVKQALELAATNAEVQFHAAVTFELAGHRAEALMAVAKARHLGMAAKVIDAEPELVALRRDPNYLRP
jgi:serine/threonine-protein kinase